MTNPAPTHESYELQKMHVAGLLTYLPVSNLPAFLMAVVNE